MKKYLLSIACLFLVVFTSFAQDGTTAKKHNYQPVVVGFYNLENLYDTINDPNRDDEEFLPASDRQYNSSVYWDKLSRLSSVITQMGREVNPEGLAVLGVAEIENDTVLHDLVKQKDLKESNFQVVHYNSPDVRGIDVGLLYNPKYFKLINSAPLFVQLPGGAKDAFFTRDVLYVKGVLLTDTVHIFVNHWPSRRGGEERSAPARAAAAMVAKVRIDSLCAIDPEAKIILMGDLNDDPVSPSMTEVLKAKGHVEDVTSPELFNPWMKMYKNGIGTLAYQDSWGLFDQIVVSHGWLSKEQKGLFYYKANIFNKEFMVQKTGKFRGYAKRTWDGITYNYGYSDHFPTYLSFLRRID
jgi:hypothetical protein